MNNMLYSALRRIGVSACMVLATLIGMAGEAQAQAFSCPTGKVEQGGFCYSPPRAGYSCTAAFCMEDCRSGYSPSVPGFCRFRGATTYTEAPHVTRRSGMQRCLAMFYKKCREGYRMDACGICTYKGAWDITRDSYVREPGINPDFAQAFVRLGSTVQATYGSSIGEIQNGYFSAVAEIQKAMDAVLVQIFYAAAKIHATREISEGMRKSQAAFTESLKDPKIVNELKRALTIVGSNKQLVDGSVEVKDVAMAVLKNTGKRGAFCGPTLAAQFGDVDRYFPANLQNTTVGIFGGIGAAVIAGADESIGIIHSCQRDANGKYQFAVIHTVGGSVGAALVAGADLGMSWGPGAVDKQGGAYVGLVGAGKLLGGAGVTVSWSVEKGMRGAQHAMPGFSVAAGPGVGAQLSLMGGYATILQRFSYKP